MKDIIRQAVADAAEWLYLERGISAKVLWATLPRNIVEAARDMRERDSSARRTEQLADFVANPVQGAETAAAADQLRDKDLWSLRRPVIDSVLIAGPEGEIARTGGFVGRCLMVPHTDNSRQQTADAAEFLWMRAPLHYSQGFFVHCPPRKIMYEAGRELVEFNPVSSHTVKLRQDGSLSNDSMSVQVGRLDFDFGLQERCADAALFLFDQGYDYALDSVHGLLKSLSPRALIRDAHAFGYNGSSASKSGRDFNKEVLLPAPKDPMWSVPVTVAYDGAEGEGRVWLSTQEEDEPMIAIEGRENAATLAGMLIDWVQPDVVVVPRALLEALRDKVDLCSGQELTGEEMETIKALTDLL